ncbi:MAG: folylpolyglutamate synthase/dihydrofolate synthase family protein [Ignavibacteria bacterium]|jgi:dihydrofolate synthase/folylpolyglutamate synthase
MKKFSNYKNCIKYLFDLERVGIKYDLKNIRKILDYLSNPEKKFKSIHIAGTNGKGSVASIINSVLIEYGYKTGLYTSPHILDFRERILINGKMINKDYILDFTNRLYNLFEEIKPSFFEATTAMAFEHFAKQKVDYAVIESGLGGRLDSTNILKPEISIITGISIDHTEYLGNSIEKIAGEKAGIVKKNIPCVIGKMGSIAKKVIREKCKEKNSEVFYAKELWNAKIIKYSEDFMEINVNENKDERNIICIMYPVIGKYQIDNVKTAFTSLDLLGKINGITFSEEVISNGFKNVLRNTKFYGRFQKLRDNPKVIIDVSHNVQGIKNIRDNLKFFKFKKLYVIFGMMKDKEYAKCLNELEKINAIIILTKPDYKRAEEPEILFKSVKNKGKFYIAENINTAYKNVKKIANKNDLILITGSFFLASDFLKLKSIHL